MARGASSSRGTPPSTPKRCPRRTRSSWARGRRCSGGRIVLFKLFIFAVFAVVIDAIVDHPEYCSLQAPPSAPPATPAISVEAAGEVCGALAEARAHVCVGRLGPPPLCGAGHARGLRRFAASADGGGGDATGDAASGEASERVLFQPE